MSKIIKWEYYDFFQDRRVKLINLLLSEVIFLKTNYRKSECDFEKDQLEDALEKIEYLLDILKSNETCLSEADFDKIINFVYQIFQSIVKNLKK